MTPSPTAPDPLSDDELDSLVTTVFAPRRGEGELAFLVDLPHGDRPDRPEWRERRRMAVDWCRRLGRPGSRFETTLFVYPHVGQNNADLPERMWPVGDSGELPDAGALDPASGVDTTDGVFRRFPILIAPTELSATAPLKVAAREHGFRAATMPGFEASMVPALRLDFRVVDARVRHLAELLDDATGADVHFVVWSDDGEGAEHSLHLDLRHRTAHASGGLVTEPGTAGNLPSGETYIVPYEGERDDDPSRTRGTLPVELDGEVVVYRVAENRAVEVLSDGPRSRDEAEHLEREPAYSNLAELGLGVLADLGIAPVGRILLDEKLGLHIAFGRSNHFGGQVGPEDFTSPEAVVHIDRVYLPETQPRVRVPSVRLRRRKGDLLLMEDGRYRIDFPPPAPVRP